MEFERAAAALREARHLLIGAGAGMGVDSGLPDFRGPQGFWNAYPPYQRLGLRFSDLANPRWFDRDPAFAWGFYGHRLHLYRGTVPHSGFQVLRRAAQTRTTFVFTSNVDGGFQAAGFEPDQIEECHGSIHTLQCSAPCSDALWPAAGIDVEVDPVSFRATSELPTCPRCGAVARPAILMFGDGQWISDASAEQAQRYAAFRRSIEPEATVVIECGAGTAIPSVRWESETLQARGATLIRINPRESHGPRGTISLPVGAAEALAAIEAHL